MYRQFFCYIGYY